MTAPGKRRVVHWFNLRNPRPVCECGYLPNQGQEERQSYDRKLVTSKKCLRAKEGKR